jgi:hypothetical protein
MIDPDSDTLVAEMIAARLAGDDNREREARRKLETEIGVKLFWANELESQQEVPHAE